MSAALRFFGLLDVLSSAPAGPSVALVEKPPDAPCIHARLRRLATKRSGKCGLGISRRNTINDHVHVYMNVHANIGGRTRVGAEA